MKRKITICAAILLIAIIFMTGCTSTDSSGSAITTPVQTATVSVTPEPTYSVTEPILITGQDIYSIKITSDAKETAGNTLYVSVHYDSSTSLSSTGVGSELMATLFAYNYGDVPYDFNPQTPDDVINAGIPYKKIRSDVYPNNKVDATAEFPIDSVQGGLNIAMPYNYGAIIEKTGTRN